MQVKAITQLITVGIILFGCPVSPSQAQAKHSHSGISPSDNHSGLRKSYARYDANGNMTSVVSLFDLATTDDCKKEKTYSGIITSVEFNNKREIESFSIRVQTKGKKSWLLRYDFPPDPYEGELEPLDCEKLPTLIRKGNRVRVESYACGLKAYALFSHSINKF